MVDLIIKIIECFMSGIMIGPVIALFITPIFMLFRLQFILPLIQDKLLEKAKQDGHVIEATLYKKYSLYRESNMDVWVDTGGMGGIYKYEYKGRMRKVRVTSAYDLPDKINLYYIKNPKKAELADYIGFKEAPWLKSFLIISLIFGVLISVGVMIFGLEEFLAWMEQAIPESI